MAKIKTAFFCQNCGAQSPKWIGKCPSCQQWNTYVEEVVEKTSSSLSRKTGLSTSSSPIKVQDIVLKQEMRISSGNAELDRVLGGGIVSGALILIGGEPGIGKSTLMLQIALKMEKVKILYVSGEESEMQIRMRAERLGLTQSQCYILAETSLEKIFLHIQELQPEMLVIDSVQTLQTEIVESGAGSISQIRECTAQLQRYSKENQVPVFLIGHITKDGTLAGPKILEHIVDAVLHFEGDRHHFYRIVRAVKNRFGSTNEIGIFEMQGNGLREVTNPSEILLSHREEAVSGVAISATMEGLRPLMIETQALVSSAAYGTPQRSGTGFDLRRLNMLLAVLEKRCGFRLSAKDVFLNITGGIKVDDPAIDLGVIVAILSSSEDIPVSEKFCFAAEVGLSGEIRPVSRVEQRIAEASKLGFDAIFISRFNPKTAPSSLNGLKVIPVSKIEEVFQHLFG